MEIKTICVCGAGTMGSGIAQVAAQAGYNTIQYDVNDDIIGKSLTNIESSLAKLVEKKKLGEEESKLILKRILFTKDINDCKADIIIEAIIENEEAKISLFSKLSAINNHNSILVSNTSSLSINSLAEKIERPERFAGMHFFNPAPLMKLVEIVKADITSDSTIETVTSLATKMNKIPVVCKDSPGFIVNRVARHYYQEAMFIAEKNNIKVEDIDAVMEARGFKMGPFKLMDLIGLDINYSVNKIVWHSLGKPERLNPSALQEEKIQSGNLGRKTRKGFYNY